MFSSSSLRLAAIYTAVFAIAVAALGLITIAATRAALMGQFEDRIRTEWAAVRADYDSGGVNGLKDELAERLRTPGELDFGVQTTVGKPVAGVLATLSTRPGWSDAKLPSDPRRRTLHVLAQDLPGGYRLIAADDLARIRALDGSMMLGFGAAFLGVILIGAVGGIALSREVHNRVSAISSTAQAIIDGDLARRAPAST